MNSSPRHPAPRALAVLLALSLAGSLSGCLGAGSTRLAGYGPRPDPPPIPLRRPTPPMVRPALAGAARKAKDWRLVFEDEQALIFQQRDN